MVKIIKLPPANGLTGRYLTKRDHYNAYTLWRKSEGYKLWRNKQWKAQKGRCYYCKIDLRDRRTNVEHVLAQSFWGETKGKNMVISCPECNKTKGSSKASKELRNEISRFNHIKRHRKRSQKRKWERII